jgi:hypothetical protein
VPRTRVATPHVVTPLSAAITTNIVGTVVTLDAAPRDAAAENSTERGARADSAYDALGGVWIEPLTDDGPENRHDHGVDGEHVNVEDEGDLRLERCRQGPLDQHKNALGREHDRRHALRSEARQQPGRQPHNRPGHDRTGDEHDRQARR